MINHRKKNLSLKAELQKLLENFPSPFSHEERDQFQSPRPRRAKYMYSFILFITTQINKDQSNQQHHDDE